MRLIRVTLLATGAVLVVAIAFAVAPGVARAAFCSCGYTSKEVRAWNNSYLATPAGQARIDSAVTHEVLVNPPALAPFIDQAGRIVKRRARGIAAHTLAWFKAVYLRCPDGTPGCKAMRQCLIAGYTAYVTARLAGLDKPTALKIATTQCIVAAFQLLASGGRAYAQGSNPVAANTDRHRYRPGGGGRLPTLAIPLMLAVAA